MDATPVTAYDVALLDLDGVVYRGPDQVPHAAPALAAARRGGMALAFVTNNASRTPGQVAEHLVELGVPADPEEVVTSAQAAARVLAEIVPAGARVLRVGGRGLTEALRDRGLVPVEHRDDGPVAVVQGFDPDVGWRQLAEAAYAVRSGLPWVATNTDRTVPTRDGIAPGNGTLVSAVAEASGGTPVVAGKPELPMHREAVERTGARRPVVVGDRLDTDIEAARRAGVPGLLVLTGVTSAADLALADTPRRPDLVGADLRCLQEPLSTLAVRAGAHRCGRWTATSHGDGRLELVAGPTPPTTDADRNRDRDRDRADAVRALAGASWALLDDGVRPDLECALRTLADTADYG